MVDRVKSMLGHVSRFDFAQVGRNLPQVDLPDLERFFSLMVETSGRRVFRRDDGLEVKTPADWAEEDYTLAERYGGLVFDRKASLGRQGAARLLGVGHRLFDTTLAKGERRAGVLACCARLEQPVLIASIEDEVTGQGHSVTRLIVAAHPAPDGTIKVLRDWELLILLNQLGRSDRPAKQIADSSNLHALEGQLVDAIKGQISTMANMMTRPRLRSEGMLVPE